MLEVSDTPVSPSNGELKQNALLAFDNDLASDHKDELASPDSVTRSYRANCPVVGIGASAGGLEALENLFRTVPADLGYCYIVVTHLDPNHKSLLTQLLQRYTSMPVRQIEDGTPIEPNHVFVIPPNRTLKIQNGLLRTAEPAMPRGFRDPINCFFFSLAEEFGNWAVSIVLSGTGSDGTAGCQEIRNRGGYVLVQDCVSAQYEGMPKSVVDASLENFVGSPPQLAQELAQRRNHIRNFYDIRTTEKIDPELKENFDTEYLAFLQAVQEKSGQDLTNYKRPTILRRLERRMTAANVSGLSAYTKLIRSDTHEVDRFLSEILINVTSFFRDPVHFEVLRTEVLRELVRANARNQSTIRVWVAGCSSGEEAYTLAMLLLEEADAQRVKVPFTIFATDLDPSALDVARAGFYTDAAVSALSQERRERFFVKEEGGHRVSRQLRNSVVFALHNLAADAPLSRIDLVVCRNVFIYFDASLQQRCVQFFHYALNHGGYLFLGPSENIPDGFELFRAKNEKSKIFVKERGFPRERRDLPKARLFVPAPQKPAPGKTSSVVDQVASAAHACVVQHYVPPTVIVGENYDVLHTIGPVDAILQLPAGAMDHNLLSMCPASNRLELRALIRSTFSSTKDVGNEEGIRILSKQGDTYYDAIARMLPPLNGGSRIAAISFEKISEQVPCPRPKPEGDSELETELRNTREFLQSVVDELEQSNQELKGANEELTSMNEELQSTTEELETSKEELQSINEELQSVNAELQEKVSQLADSNDDMSNLLNGTEIATLFLDANLCIKRYTPSIVPIFRLLPTDLGRPISHISHTIGDVDLAECFGWVLKTMNVLERELCTRTGEWYIMRGIPYRTQENTISGVVVTFSDVTELKNFQDALSRSEGRNHALLDSIPDTLVVVRADGTISDFKAGRGTIQLLPPHPFGRNLTQLLGSIVPTDLSIDMRQVAELTRGIQTVLTEGGSAHVEMTVGIPSGPTLWFDAHLVPCGSDSVLCIFRNVSERKELESRLNRALQIAEKSSRAKSDFVANVSHELRTPLNAIIGFADLMQLHADKISEEDRRNFIAHIKEGGKVLLSLVNAILDLAKIESGHLELRYGTFVAQDVIRNCLNLARPVIDRKKITLEVNLPVAPIEVFADEDRVVQVLLNLVSNAGKFTHDGGKIRVSAESREDERFYVSVADSGIGVPESDRARIFERFVQAGKSNKGVGTGLGLTLAKNFVELHGGEISLSCPGLDGKGSTFSFWLPMRFRPEKKP